MLPTGLQSSLFLWALTGPRSLPAACVGAPRGTHIRGLVTILPARPSPPLPSVEGLRTGEEDVCAPPRPPAQAVRGPGTLRTLSLPCWLMWVLRAGRAGGLGVCEHVGAGGQRSEERGMGRTEQVGADGAGPTGRAGVPGCAQVGQ